MAAKNSAFCEGEASRTVALPMSAWSLSSHEEFLASSATTGGFYFHGHDDQAAIGEFYFHGHDGQAATQPCGAATAGSVMQHYFASTSTLLQDGNACKATHGGSLEVDAATRNATVVEMTRRHVIGTAATVLPGTVQRIVKGQWSTHEDTLLLKLVEQYGTQKWSEIAKHLIGRVGKQCRERWNNHLRPNIKKDTWTEEEEKIFVEAHLKLGNKWATIAKYIPGRSENTVKNHWNSIKRSLKAKRWTKKKAEPGPRPTILADYIRGKIASLEVGGHPALTPSAPAPSNQLELALDGPANSPTAPSSFDRPTSSQLGDYPRIAPPAMHPHMDLSSYYIPQDSLDSSTYSYQLDFLNYPDDNYLQPFGYTPDPSKVCYDLYCQYPKCHHRHDASLDKAFAHIELGEERKPCPGYSAQASSSGANMGDMDLVEMVSQQMSLSAGGYVAAARRA